MSSAISRIRSYLADHPWLDLVHYYDTVDSTNTLAKSLASDGAPSGTVLIADRQLAGRGRMGRRFSSPGGMGVYFSVILRPGCPPTSLMHLTCAAAVTACDAVERAFGFRPRIKWTNDLVFGNRKLAGILTELSLDPKTGAVDYAVIGVGINCCQTPEDFEPSIQSIACSARMVTGAPVERERLCAELIRSFSWLDQTLLTEKDAVMQRYRRDCITIGQSISILQGTQVRHARATGITGDGALLVTYDDGSTGEVTSGEVSIRGMYGYV